MEHVEAWLIYQKHVLDAICELCKLFEDIPLIFASVNILQRSCNCYHKSTITAKFQTSPIVILLYAEKTMNMAQTLDFSSCHQVEVSTQHQNVSEMMSSWTSQKGFPLVTVSRKGDQVTLTQQQFLLTSDNTTHTSRWVTLPHTQTHTQITPQP